MTTTERTTRAPGPGAGPPAVDSTVRRAMWAVAAVFTLNGFAFASWVSRIPSARDDLGLEPGRLGLVLLGLCSPSHWPVWSSAAGGPGSP